MTETSIPQRLAPGLDLFAAAWLQKWCEGGGSVQLDDEGKALFGFPDYHSSPAFIEIAGDLPEAVNDEKFTWRSGHYYGRMRALLDLLEVLPEGSNAVKAHMRSHGMRVYLSASGSRS